MVDGAGAGNPSDTPTALARQLLERVRREESTTSCLQALAGLHERDLERVRNDRHHALAFWLNLYNSGTQLLLQDRPELFDSRWRFFSTPAITVAGVSLSLDDIEHGILRARRSKYGFGYAPRLARTGLGAAYHLEPEPRIHFALNCGAAGCPAILAYRPETVEETLEDATRSFLSRSVRYDPDRDRVFVPRVCLWFLGDFGGLSGLRSFLTRYEHIPTDSAPSIRFQGYDWTSAPRRFADEFHH